MILSRISWPFVCLAIFVIGFAGWISDRVTLQGERSVYSADCEGGEWQGKHCSGHLVAGDRFRFRALRAHNEVFFWIAGSTTVPSGRFGDCIVEDGSNWRCEATAELDRTITREMVRGVPVADTSGRALPFHRIPKWRWLLLKAGVPAGNEVD